MVLMWSLFLFVLLTGMLYLLGVNVWLGRNTVIDRVSGQDWQSQEAAHPSLAFRDVIEKLGDLVPASPKELNLTQKRLIRAGFRSPLALKMFFGAKVGLLIVLPIVAFPLSFRFDWMGDNRLAVLAGAAGLGYFGPNQVLLSLVKRRAKKLGAKKMRKSSNCVIGFRPPA